MKKLRSANPLFVLIAICKKYLALRLITAILVFCFISPPLLKAQCGAGYYNCTVNWDNLDYLVTSGTYAGYVSNAMSETQKFAIGVNYVTIIRTSSITALGEDSLHTGEAGSFSTGADVHFDGTGIITLTFNSEVQNVRFSIYDIDNSQSVNITAADASSAAQNITLAAAAGASTALTITGSGTNSATASGSAADESSSGNLASANITITGSVKTVTITISAATGDFWLSDISACVLGTFPNDYFAIMQPYTGQPTYVIATTSDTNTVSLINTANGSATAIFQDNGTGKLNGLGYDPVKNEIYYTSDLNANSNKAYKKYNFNTQTISTIIPDVTALGIPVFDRGVGSAGCSFYNGELYLGIEANYPANVGGRENIIWRVNFDGSGNPVSACQALAFPADNGASTSMHDWGDFVVIDSMIVDFTPNSSATGHYTHYNMRSGNIDNDYPTITGDPNRPRQVAMTWNDQLYWVFDSIALYNGNGTIGPKTKITGATILDWGPTGLANDATGFRPQSDFGDAPASYDPDPLSPALHMKDTALRLGLTFDQEFVKSSSALADGDGSDEDAISTVNVLDTATTNYITEISVYNNSGANATLIGWLDIDGDGVFEPSEAVTATVPQGGPVLQTITLQWTGINTPLVPGQVTYLRIRLTSGANGMTASNATGYFPNGEVEDYIVYIYIVLPVDILSFNATVAENKKVNLDWSAENESNLKGYEIQRSADGIQWKVIGFVNARNQSGLQQYGSWDLSPLQGKIQYRLRIADTDGKSRYSNIKTVMFDEKQLSMKIFPNPVDSKLIVNIYSDKSSAVKIYVYDIRGNKIHISKFNLTAGENHISLETEKFPAGIYIVTAETPGGIITEKFVKR